MPHFGVLGPNSGWHSAVSSHSVRIESSVTSVYWITSEAIAGLPEVPLAVEAADDDPPPGNVADLGAMPGAGAQRSEPLGTRLQAQERKSKATLIAPLSAWVASAVKAARQSSSGNVWVSIGPRSTTPHAARSR